MDCWRFSQFLHGEQGALVCAARVIQTVPDLDAKFYAATQVFDEARHVEVFSRYLREKLGMIYPINPNLKVLLEQALGDARWDLTYLAMQVLSEEGKFPLAVQASTNFLANTTEGTAVATARLLRAGRTVAGAQVADLAGVLCGRRHEPPCVGFGARKDGRAGWP